MTPLAQLRDQITSCFNKSELYNLAFDLGIYHEELPGDTLSDQARELVAYCVRHGLVKQLVQRCRELRPHAKWKNPKKTLILDPSCGTGGLLVATLQF